jgi:hypothetical protein
MRKQIMKIFITIILLFITTNVFGAPAITSVSGTFTNGQSITINGSGFGTKSSAGPLVSSFDNATSSNNWATGSLGGSWTSSGTIGLSSSAPLRTSLPESSYKISYNTNGSYASVRYNDPKVEDKLYISFWMYRDYSSWNIRTGSGDNNKFLRIYENGSGSGGDVFSTIHSNSSGNADSLVIQAESDLHTPTIAHTAMGAFFYSSAWYDVRSAQSNANLKLQSWEHYEYYIDYPTNLGGADGTGIVWKDGRQHSRTINAPMNYSTGTPDRRWVVLGLVSGGRSTSGNEYIDQVYIDNTPAHVFISNASSLLWPDQNTEHHSEIQVSTAWSNTGITFKLNQGSFPNSSTVYLYVVDPNGAISNPYPISIGGSESGGGADTTPPATPSGVTVKVK